MAYRVQFTVFRRDGRGVVAVPGEPVEKMVDDLLASYETKGLSEMLAEANAKAADLGIKVK